MLDIPSIEFRCTGFRHDVTAHRGVSRQTGRLLLCAVLAFTGTAVAETDLEPVIPDDIRAAYNNIDLTEAQEGSFDPLMLDAINEIKSMLKKEGLKARWPFERRIRVKANFILERHAPALRDTLEQHQIPAFEEYTALVLETMTSLSPKEYEGVAFGPVIGVIERGD